MIPAGGDLPKYTGIEKGEAKQYISKAINYKKLEGPDANKSRILANLWNKITVTMNQIGTSILGGPRGDRWVNDETYAKALKNNIRVANMNILEMQHELKKSEITPDSEAKITKDLKTWEERIGEMQKICKLLKKSGRSSEDSASIEQDLDMLKKNINLQKAEMMAKKDVEPLQNQLKALTNELAQKNASITELQRNLEYATHSQNSKIEKLEIQLKSTIGIADLRLKEQNETHDQFKQAIHERNDYQLKNKNLSKEINDLKVQIEKKDEQIRNITNDNRDIKNNLTRVTTDLESTKTQLNKEIILRSTLQRQLQEVQNEKAQQARDLQAQKNLEKSFQKINEQVTNLEKEIEKSQG